MRIMAGLTLLVLALPALAQDNEAEKLYRSFEKKLRTAKTVEFDFEGAADGKAFKLKMKGNVKLAEGRVARLDLEMSEGPKSEKMLMISDGKSTYMKQGDKANVRPRKDGDPEAEEIRGAFARVGMAPAFMLGRRADGTEKRGSVDEELDKGYRLSNFKLLPDEMVAGKKARVIEYNVVIEGKQTCVAKIWFDATTQLPLKRTFAITGELAVDMVDTFSTFTMDAKIDPKAFEIPQN